MATNNSTARNRRKKTAKGLAKPSKKLAYLYKAREVFRFQIAIPEKIRHLYDGAATINRPTGTGDQREAIRIRDQLLVQCRAEFGRLIRGLAAAGPNISPAEIERIKAERQIEHQAKLRYEYWRDRDSQEAESFFLSNHQESLGAEALLRARGKPPTPENLKIVNDALMEAIDRAIAHDARGLAPPILPPHSVKLAEKIEQWIEDNRGNLEKRQRRTYKREADRFAEWLKLHNYPETSSEVSRIHAGEYLAHMRSQGLSGKSITNNRSALAMFWSYLIEAGLASENIWHSLVKRRSNGGSKAQRREARKRKRRPFEDHEVAALIYGPPFRMKKWEPVLRDAMYLTALHALRASEIAWLRVRDCKNDLISIVDAKTEAGIRIIPQHSAAKKIIAARMAGKDDDDFLFPELPLAEIDAAEEKGAPISKHFTEYRRASGVDDRPVKANGELERYSLATFHSFRRWAIRQMRDAWTGGAKHYSPWTIAAVVGHDDDDDLGLVLTMVDYAGEQPLEAKRAAIEAIKLPKQQK